MPRSASPDPGHQEAGYKAALNNPRVGESAKQHARQVLEDQFGDTVFEQQMPEGGRSRAPPDETVEGSKGGQRNKNNVMRGLKAAMHNQTNTDQGRESARHKLEDLGQNPEE
ncbi:hypothetical protein UA08_02239 [Talaromyces atroroseus]|uniref:Conidiation-specific protein 6 n=1 Tax=Talaromyces atroroseus TaxID=1441469 RepID=A0A225AR25_TALAT|nr:hypothetical protein UA08_02239 [Talaromyces atroroseus]OKL61953.1 hypothetical protein UA08_02239 [Talaromyces atroroseus]